MKFCAKCGKHYSDSDKFCKNCGVELTQMEAKDAGVAESLKENVSTLASKLGDGAKDALSSENVQKLKDQTKEAAAHALDAAKNMSGEKGKQLIDDGIESIKSNPFNKKFIMPIVAVILIIAGFFVFSSSNTPEGVARDYMELQFKIHATRDKNAMLEAQQLTAPDSFLHTSADQGSIFNSATMGHDMNRKILKVSKLKEFGDMADVAIEHIYTELDGKTYQSITGFHLQKLNGKWLITGFIR